MSDLKSAPTLNITDVVAGPIPPRVINATWPNVLHTRISDVVAEMGEENIQAWIRRFGRKVVRMMDALTDLANHTSFYPDLTKARPIARDRLRALTCPIRAVYGEQSDVPNFERQLHDLLPHATTTVVAGVGHSVLMDATPAVREIVVAWLAEQE